MQQKILDKKGTINIISQCSIIQRSFLYILSIDKIELAHIYLCTHF